MVFFFFGERGACVSSFASWSEAVARAWWTCLVDPLLRGGLSPAPETCRSPATPRGFRYFGDLAFVR